MSDPGFVWNYDLLKDFMMQGISQRWVVPLIQGYCSTDVSKTYLSKQIAITLLSKRHTSRAGTRFNQRGIDEEGRVANFVTSELVVEQLAYQFAHV